MRYLTLSLLTVAGMLVPAAGRAGEIRIVTSTADLAYFARAIGQDRVEVHSLASPRADVHYIEVRPSHMVKVKRADIVLKVGLELDLWMDPIIDGSRNSDLVIVDCSRYIEPLEVPAGEVDARHGDLHRFGNPHYWLDPSNVRPLTRAVLEGLIVVAPHEADRFTANREALLQQLDSAVERLRTRAAPLQGREVVFYHNTWPYFAAFTGVVAAGFIEPYPGVPPSPSHLSELIRSVRERQIGIIAIEPYFDGRMPERVARETGARVVTLYPSIGGRRSGESYLDFLAGNIDALLEVSP